VEAASGGCYWRAWRGSPSSVAGRRLDLSVLDWNPARGFYQRLGFRHTDGWLPYRLSGDALGRLAAESV
jgi:hypothetical protein